MQSVEVQLHVGEFLPVRLHRPAFRKLSHSGQCGIDSLPPIGISAGLELALSEQHIPAQVGQRRVEAILKLYAQLGCWRPQFDDSIREEAGLSYFGNRHQDNGRQDQADDAKTRP